MQADEVRRLALSLPGSTEEPHFDMTSFRVGGRIFATISPDGARLHVFLDELQSRAVAASDPAAYQELHWGRQLRGVGVSLAAAQAAAVYELLEDAWRRRAPRRLVEALEASRRTSQAQ